MSLSARGKRVKTDGNYGFSKRNAAEEVVGLRVFNNRARPRTQHKKEENKNRSSYKISDRCRSHRSYYTHTRAHTRVGGGHLFRPSDATYTTASSRSAPHARTSYCTRIPRVYTCLPRNTFFFFAQSLPRRTPKRNNTTRCIKRMEYPVRPSRAERARAIFV